MDRLREHNKRGLIHAPDESDGGFYIRCERAEKQQKAPSSPLAHKLFDIDPDWITISYSDHRLRLWEGGCTWISGNQVTLQLRKAFETHTRYLGYSREEIVAHELVHVVRHHFEEPIFEEILAYQTSPSFLRRYFGPIFRSSKESLIFIGALSFALVSTFFATFQTLVYLGMTTLFVGGSFRLFKAQYRFSRARKRIGEVVGKERALAVMIRLTDREIVRFSKMKKEQIVSYAVKMSRTHIRWQQIRNAYFVKNK